jgi:hypothetical protein
MSDQKKSSCLRANPAESALCFVDFNVGKWAETLDKKYLKKAYKRIQMHKSIKGLEFTTFDDMLLDDYLVKIKSVLSDKSDRYIEIKKNELIKFYKNV